MSTYKGIFGKTIKHLSSDPDNSTYEGQIWYNTTEGKFKTVVAAGAWISSSPLIVARDAAGSAGTQTTATIFGGNINPGNTSATDEYNGSGFSSGGTLNTARRQTTGCGLQTAALCVGGYTTANAANVEEYNGTSWSEQNDIPGNYRNGSTFGTQTAALYVGGYSVPVPNSNVIQIYDGTNWTISPATLGTGGNSISSTGTSTAGLVFGGSNRLNATEEWNGTAMSTGGNLTTSKYGRGSANQAPSENAMSAGGGIPAQTTVENYDGTTWSTLPSLAVATNAMAGAGTASAAMMMGGGPGAGPVFNTSTEFNFTANTITAAAWASGGNLSTGRYGLGSAGTQTAALAIGGEGPPEQITEEYNGSSWTAGGNLSTGRYYVGGAGLQDAGLAVGGRTPGSFAVTDTEHYGGTSWTSGGALPSAANGKHTSGTQTAGLAWGGISSPGGSSLTVTDEYDGSNWTSGGTLPSGVRYGVGTGTQTAALNAGGDTPGLTLYYNGTSWASQAPQVMLPQSKSPLGFFAGGFGTQTASVVAGGRDSPGANKAVTSQQWDGSAWSTAPNLSTARGYGGVGPVGSTTAGAVFGGQGDAPSYANINATEEFTGETTAINIESVDNS